MIRGLDYVSYILAQEAEGSYTMTEKSDTAWHRIASESQYPRVYDGRSRRPRRRWCHPLLFQVSC